MALRDILGDPPDWPARPPWRPATNECACCQRFLTPEDGAFCPDCELHRSWCVPMKAREPQFWEPDKKRWRIGKRTKPDAPQAALF